MWQKANVKQFLASATKMAQKGYFFADFQVSQISYLKSTLDVCIDDQGCVNFKSSIIRSIGRRCV